MASAGEKAQNYLGMLDSEVGFPGLHSDNIRLHSALSDTHTLSSSSFLDCKLRFVSHDLISADSQRM